MGEGVGLPGTYVGATVGADEGKAVGLRVGKGVGLPGKYVGDIVGSPDGAAVGAAEG